MAKLALLGVPIGLAEVFGRAGLLPFEEQLGTEEACVFDRSVVLEVLSRLERQLKLTSSRPGSPSNEGLALMALAAVDLFGQVNGMALMLKNHPETTHEEQKLSVLHPLQMEMVAQMEDAFYWIRALNCIGARSGPTASPAEQSYAEESFILFGEVLTGPDDNLEVWPRIFLCTPDKIAFLAEEDLMDGSQCDALAFHYLHFDRCLVSVPPGFPEIKPDNVEVRPATGPNVYFGFRTGDSLMRLFFAFDPADTRVQQRVIALVERVDSAMDDF